jgi:hypothetical protein
MHVSINLIFIFSIFTWNEAENISTHSKSAHKLSKETLSMLVIFNTNSKYVFVGTLYGHVHRDI